MKAALLPLALLLATLPASARTLGSLEFTDCDLAQPGTGATVRAQCATLEVPEDPARPEYIGDVHVIAPGAPPSLLMPRG